MRSTVIRSTDPADVPAVLDLVVAAGMFSRQESGLVEDLYAKLFAEDGVEGHASVVGTGDDGRPLAAAYWKPHDAADRVWDLTMIAVRPDLQRGGRGSALLGHVEAALRADGQRLLLVETSSTPAYDAARAFYARTGYDEEARVRDYWTAGDDLVLFRKALGPA